MKMKWISCKDELPNNFEAVLVLISFLDAPYGEHGYDDANQFWTLPNLMLTSGHRNSDGDFIWECGGKVIKWARIPEPEDEEINVDI